MGRPHGAHPDLARTGVPRPTDDTPPPRPALEEVELRFDPQKAVRWYSPGALTGSGLHVGLTSVFGSFLDKRELQARKAPTVDHSYATRDEMWIDYRPTPATASATMTVASHLARRALGRPHRRRRAGAAHGDVLVLGGDEVYPGASAKDYENRLEGPFRAALPWTVGEHPAMYAVPGNHDWYDGLTGFLRLFTQHRSGRRLDHPAEPQLLRGRAAAQLVAVGRRHPARHVRGRAPARVLRRGGRQGVARRQAHPGHAGAHLDRARARPERVTTTSPSSSAPCSAPTGSTSGSPWPATCTTTRYTLHGSVGDDGPPASPPHKITAGGGGAFLHPTHDLRREVEIIVDPDDPGDRATYRMVAAYPRPEHLAPARSGRWSCRCATTASCSCRHC